MSKNTSNTLILPYNELQKLLVDSAGWSADANILTRLDLMEYENVLRHVEAFTDPVADFLDILRQPANFGWTAKIFLNIDLLPFQISILNELWNRKFPMFIASRGAGKSFLLALYAILKAIIEQGSKIIIVGGAFRQSKILFEYMEAIWKGSPRFRGMIGTGIQQGPKRDIDRCTFHIGDSIITAIPVGDGSTIRGLRANCIIVDEFASVNKEVFEVVIKGFGAVSLSPDEKVIAKSKLKVMKKLSMVHEAELLSDQIGFGNQTIISGTPYYTFNHFYDYFAQYKKIVESKGNQQKLEEIFQGEVPDDFDWTQYSVIRLPHDVLPDGFMDKTQIAQSKALVHESIYNMEYGAIFPKDSNGFFKRSMIEKCVTHEPIVLPSGEVQFSAAIKGNPNCKYIYGIDPASEHDNFSIIILEIHEDHHRIVYGWSVNRAKLRERLKSVGNNSNQHSFYNYCAQKIRQLLKVFPSDHVAIDSQGGGISIMEALHDVNIMSAGDLPIWPYIRHDDEDGFWWETSDKPTDGEIGLHILHLVNFANAQFTLEANHGLRKDFENQTLLFPMFDSFSIGEAIADDKMIGREYDTLEDCVMEIEELKDELATIIHTQTATGRDKWDTPEIKLTGNKKGRMRKDRYSALVIANMIARILKLTPDHDYYQTSGGFAGQHKFQRNSNDMYFGPNHIARHLNAYSGRGVSRAGV